MSHLPGFHPGFPFAFFFPWVERHYASIKMHLCTCCPFCQDDPEQFYGLSEERGGSYLRKLLFSPVAKVPVVPSLPAALG